MPEEKEFEVQIKWENQKFFRMRAKPNGADWMTIIEVEENGCLNNLWPHIENLCNQFFQERMNSIGNEMKVV